MNELKIRNIDHLGIIAGIVEQIGLVEIVNAEIGENSQEKISAGIVVKAIAPLGRAGECDRESLVNGKMGMTEITYRSG
jgi:hypothetical protein